MQGKKIEYRAADGDSLFRFTLAANGIEKEIELLYRSPSNWFYKANEGDWMPSNPMSLIFALEFDLNSIRETFSLVEHDFKQSLLVCSFPFSKIAAYAIASMGWYWAEKTIGWIENEFFVPDAALISELEKAIADARFGQSPTHRLQKLTRNLKNMRR